ncbi:hypothetical protein EMPS_08200 [Entomortierella parvispora]|uniref:Zn(2)-C6 fungal-type domain-containing protein n=1 Tax=Entomortierella parvispora TaxID=205924 RepID=A0A9P3HGG0_9FUNG|nr:hypothetical protein EMPS_08200 [Entomortierella parvispora]
MYSAPTHPSDLCASSLAYEQERQLQDQHHHQDQQHQHQHQHLQQQQQQQVHQLQYHSSHSHQKHQHGLSGNNEGSRQHQWSDGQRVQLFSQDKQTGSFVDLLSPPFQTESRPRTLDPGAQQFSDQPSVHTAGIVTQFSSHYSIHSPHLSLSSTVTRPLTVSSPHCPGEPRKRHKIATSCNRCRQNKRKCDGGVPCSTCKRINVDCCYTDAQLSRALWGDSPLSREKVQGTIAAKKPGADPKKRKSLSSKTGDESTSQPLFAPVQPLSQLSPQPSQLFLPAIPITETGCLIHPDTAASNSSILDLTARAVLSKSYQQSLDHIIGNQSRQMTKMMRVLQPVPPSSPVFSSAMGFAGANPQSQHQPLKQELMEGLLETGLSDPTTLSQQAQLNDDIDSIEAMTPWQHVEMLERQLQVIQQLQQQQQQIFGNKDLDLSQPQRPNGEAPSLLDSEQENFLQDIRAEVHNFALMSKVAPIGGVNNLDADYFSGVHLPDLIPLTMTVAEATATTTEYNISSDVSISGEDKWLSSEAPLSWSSAATMTVSSATTPVSLASSLSTPMSSNPGRHSSPEKKADDVVEFKAARMAADLLAIRRYDIAFRIPRHIHDEVDEIWIPPTTTEQQILDPSAIMTDYPFGDRTKRVPKHLRLIPADADYLINAFFEHAHFYSPVVNRAAVELAMMESDKPHSMLLLNVVFMTACKHLNHTREFDRAIKFRERARELQDLVDDRRRLTVLQACLLGSLVTYGVFRKNASYMAAVLGVHDGRVPMGSSPEKDWHLDSPENNLFPESAYQARLWCFWGLYVRNCVNRLYFGWPNALDNRAVTAELPRIEGCIGIGSTVPSTVPSLLPQKLIGKRRDTRGGRQSNQRIKKRPLVDLQASQGPRQTYCRSNFISSDEEEDEEERGVGGMVSDGSDDDISCPVRVNGMRNIRQNLGSTEGPRTRCLFQKNSHRLQALMEGAQACPVLSYRILVQQSETLIKTRAGEKPDERRDSPTQQMETEEIQAQEMELHMDRMRLLIESKEDATDNGTFARRLFLEEIRLWSIGRRLAVYLSDRSAKRALSFGRPTVNVAFACSSAPARSSFSSVIETKQKDTVDIQGSKATHPSPNTPCGGWQLHPAAEWSEQAWLQDGELQKLQADLIAWERDLPNHLRFRSDVESEDVDHRINGKMSVLIMSYYTMTIMLQSSYLPSIQPGKKASNANSEAQVPSTLSPSQHKSGAARDGSTEGNRKGTNADTSQQGGRPDNSSPTPSFSSGQFTPAEPAWEQDHVLPRRFANPAHKICTELSNTLLHHVEIMLDTYPNWCSIQAKVNHAIMVCMRVACENSKPNMTCPSEREEAQAQFRMGSDLYRRLSVLPEPLTIRDRPVETDVHYMDMVEESFREMLVSTSTMDDDNDDKNEHCERQEPEPEQGNLNLQDGAVSEMGNAQSQMVPPLHIFGNGGERSFDFEFPMPNTDLP